MTPAGVLDTVEIERVYRDWSRPVARPVAAVESAVEQLRAEVVELEAERRELLQRLERQEAAIAAERERWLGIIGRYTQRLAGARAELVEG
jgi:predicted  nucleic acid-binding Zn-ribbon protein